MWVGKPTLSTPVVTIPAAMITPLPAITIYSSAGGLFYTNPADVSSSTLWWEIWASQLAEITAPNISTTLEIRREGGTQTSLGAWLLGPFGRSLAGEGVFTFAQAPQTSSPTNSLSTTTSPSLGSSTHAANTVTTSSSATGAPPPPVHGLSGGVIAATVLGALLGIVLLGVLIWYIRFRPKNKA